MNRAATTQERLFRLQRDTAPYLFVAPFIITFLIFGLYPLLKSLWLSLYITNGPKSRVFVGLGNFEFLLRDGDFHRAVINTATFALLCILTQIPVSLGLALLLNRSFVRGRNFFRFAFFSPHLFGQVFVALLFAIIFIPQYGLLNRALHFFAGFPIDTKWLQTPALIMPSLVLTALWMNIGFNMVYFLAALQSIDRTLYEAASVDGANHWRQFLHVTLPGIKPVLVFVLVIITIGSFQLYELPYVMLDGPGPENAGLTVVMFLYLQGFEAGDLGYASAIGWSLAIMVMAVAILQIIATGAWKND
jgi:ABC-type sugar transport system permease subunit